MERKEEVILGRVRELEGYEEKEPSLPGSVVAEMKELEKQREKLLKALKEVERMIGSSGIFTKFL
jgi:hypothetical protein